MTAPTELLAPGPFGVGFRSEWGFDETRTYRTEFDGGTTYGGEESPRPVLVLQWYPARPGQGETMAHGDYFAVADGDPRVRNFAGAMTAYALAMFAHYVFDKPDDELDDVDRAEMAAVLSEPTWCVEGAAPADGAFPLVVYHGGLGSSFEDNAALCAYLASHGYVVLGSAFPDGAGRSLNIDGSVGSAGDVAFLIRWARAHSVADVGRVGLIGHSAGAQAMLRFAARPEIPCDALVLLDTTQDYFSLSVPFFVPLVREVTGAVATLTAPMIVVAGPTAIFALCDTLVRAERIYLTVPGLGHDEFIAQGQQRLARLARASPADSETAAVARDRYRVVCAHVLQFLERTLRGYPDIAFGEADPWTATAPCATRVPRGASSPTPYDDESEIAPTPRQFARLMEIEGIARACRLLERFRSSSPPSPICTDVRFAGSMLYELINAGRDDDAGRYYDVLTAMSVDVARWFLEQAEDDEGELGRHFRAVANRLAPTATAVPPLAGGDGQGE